MISVQNHQQPLSGNKTLKKYVKYLAAATIVLGVASCAPKSTVLRSPDYAGVVGAGSSDKNDGDLNNRDSKEASEGSKRNVEKRTLALMLPFQLNQIASTSVAANDIKRAGLALDFYQGFELGLEELAKNGADFNLNVLDSRDNTGYVSSLASSESVKEASLLVGPIYPQEIKAFGQNFEDKNVLQVNPLAATMPTEFNLPNLVSITPPIKAHSNAIANRVAQNFKTGDIIIIYNTVDSDSRQFLNSMLPTIKTYNANVNVISVSSLSQLNENLTLTGNNYIIAGTTDKQNLNNLVSNLSKKYSENYYSINLFGHPLWDRYDFSTTHGFGSLNPIITSESHLKSWTSGAKQFRDNYYQSFGVNPADASYKGYDAAIYFGTLINKYGADNIKDKLVSEPFKGIFNAYRFKFNENWGFTNESVSFKEYRTGGFQLQ